MKLSACITTRNRTKELDLCLNALWNSTVKPAHVIVSDDSPNQEVQQQNRCITEKYPGTIYLTGPQRGVCPNRNNAVNAIPNTDLVCFIDDDVCVQPNFIASALEQYQQMPSEDKNRVIISGISQYPDGYELKPGKLTFRGYFTSSEIPETVVIHATVFPRIFFYQEQWDENIFFGYEDAELCLRALKKGYKIIHDQNLKVFNRKNNGMLDYKVNINYLTQCQIYSEAARLYVGIKRYKYITPNYLKLFFFLFLYINHMTIYLLRKSSFLSWIPIIKKSNIHKLI
ncbi:glycosyltransferase [Euhalothece natronophila Z-M001]|uniref:Glycosyltransferase n=1 Tax=Euhalothece natronophila Z-M001 TaxID=522448 RepID=A0A5B8NIQ5_9CHRO|nr:glycosyltransferase [Euhalothece natronophila]QDZ39123.1 glycosyltransferase [Euhalothece natronophila Z-M001]